MSTAHWTPNQEAHLVRMYRTRPGCELAAEFKRSTAAIYQAAARLGVSRGAWSAEEDRELKRLYTRMAPVRIAATLQRPLNSVYKRAHQLGLASKRNEWTPGQLQLLEEKFSSTSNTELAELIGHTPNQIRNKAGELGITKKQLPKDTLELIWIMKDVPDVTAFFAKQLGVSTQVIARAIAVMNTRGGP